MGDDGVARAPEDEAPAIETVARNSAGASDLGFAPFDSSFSGDAAGGPAGFEPVPFETPEISVEPPSAFDPAPQGVIDVPGDESPFGGGFGEMPSGFDAPPSPEAPMESFGMDSFQSVTPMDDGFSAEEAEPFAQPESRAQVNRVSPSEETGRPAMDFGPASDPLNLNEFANSEVSSGRDGPLLFRVFIAGIDTKEIRESIREVLNDERFRVDASATLARVSKGDLVIDGLSPVKASILVNRIKRLPVTIRWEQYAITEANL